MDPRTFDYLAFVFAAGGGAVAFMAWRRLANRLLDEAEREAEETGTSRPKTFWRMVLSPIATRMRPTNQADLERLTTRLQNAGRRARDEVDRFLEDKVAWQVGGLLSGLLFLAVIGGTGGFFLFLLAVLAGLLGGETMLNGKVSERKTAVQRGLPTAVDLLVTCLDAGLSLEQAVGRVAADLAHSDPLLAEELHLTAKEFEAGVGMADSLRRLARRVGIDELSALCGVIAQASSLGAPIAQTLREYAVSSRRQRLAVLEERAGKLSTALTLPLALCLLPAALLIILGPAAVQLAQALSK